MLFCAPAGSNSLAISAKANRTDKFPYPHKRPVAYGTNRLTPAAAAGIPLRFAHSNVVGTYGSPTNAPSLTVSAKVFRGLPRSCPPPGVPRNRPPQARRLVWKIKKGEPFPTAGDGSLFILMRRGHGSETVTSAFRAFSEEKVPVKLFSAVMTQSHRGFFSRASS